MTDRAVVQLDAVAPKAAKMESYVHDRTTLTAKQIEDWTGVAIERDDDDDGERTP